jgi:hypothetical protein
MAGERILYVCFDPALLMDRERELVSQGYTVYTVLGQDGMLAVRNLHDFDFILIGDEGSLPERQGSIRRLHDNSSPPPIIALCRDVEHIAGADYEVPTYEPKAWFEAVADCIRDRRELS